VVAGMANMLDQDRLMTDVCLSYVCLTSRHRCWAQFPTANWYAFHKVLAKNRQQGFCWRM
jgi:hypothetical protein